MSHSIRRLPAIAAVIALMVLFVAPCALAGDYHSGSGLHCSDCHIMHASKDGVEYNGGTGFAGLLKSGTVNDLCLTCHDGTDTTAPDVVSTGTATSATTTNDVLGIAYASPYKNSGGLFQSDWKTVGSTYAHNLGGGQVTAIQGTWVSGSTGMRCTNCHDPHGGENYRNLVVRPGTAGADVQVRGGTSGTQEVYLREAITIPATAGDTATHYDHSAVSYNDPNNIVEWCIGCHTNVTTGSKHPQNAALSGAEADGAHWTGGTGAGFGADISDAQRGVPRMRFAQAGSSYATCGTEAAVATTNKVFCLSCHKAHGNKFDSGIMWPHFVRDNPDRPAGCNQCHNKGL